MRTRTKIICTIGPAVSSYAKILELIDAGMNVARLNFSHGTHAEHLEVIESLKKARIEKQVPLAIMLDTKGPEIRVGKMLNDQVELKSGQSLILVKDPVIGDSRQINITPPIVIDNIKVGDTVLFDDGYIISKATQKTEKGVTLEIQNSGVLKSHKGVNIPGSHIELPAMTDQDIEDIVFGCKQDVDIIAASFIRSPAHVIEIKDLLKAQDKSAILVIAKIENAQGVENFDQIIKVADGIMVARGDLGVELPLKRVPILQKMMIKKCYLACKPVVVATQMLESMIKNPRPTRAEVSDVANAIYDSTSCVMLSGETAVGLYAIEAVKMMKSIIEETEANVDYRGFFEDTSKKDFHDVSSSVSLAAVQTAYSAQAKAIFAFTHSGFTVRLISRYRPLMPVIALTSNPKIYHQMSLNWGVIPLPPADAKNVEEAFKMVCKYSLKEGLLKEGDLVVVSAGSPFGISGTTNMMMVKTVQT